MPIKCTVNNNNNKSHENFMAFNWNFPQEVYTYKPCSESVIKASSHIYSRLHIEQ